MARKSTSELHELLTLLRRIVVMGVAVYGLAREMPYMTLAFRLVILWAVLYMACGVLDLVFRRLSYNAMVKQANDLGSDTASTNVPVMSGTKTN
jgi:hypothetical protein